MDPSTPMCTSVSRELCNKQVNVLKTVCTWTIPHFSLHLQGPCESLRSHQFSSWYLSKDQWRLKLYPRGRTTDYKDYVSLFLLLDSCDEEKIYADVDLYIIEANGNRRCVATTKCHSFATGTQWGENKFLRRHQLLCEENGLPNDNLSIRCELSAIQSIARKPRITVSDGQVLKDLNQLFECPKFSDVTLDIGGKEIPAHKGILVARSPVFAAMFEHDMSEKVQSRVVITDLEYEAVREAVRFIYTGLAPKIDEMAQDLLIIAEKYDLNELKKMSEERLSSKMSVENAAELLTLADIHNADQLKAHAINFITANATTIWTTAGWKQMAKQQPHLIDEAFRALAEKQTSDHVPSGKRMKLSGSS